MALSATISTVFANSVVWRRLTEIGCHSRVIGFSLEAARAAEVTLQTSRVAGFLRRRVFPVFLVGNYLDRESDFLMNTCDHSMAFGYCRRVLFSGMVKLRALGEIAFSPRGELLSRLFMFVKEIESGGRKKVIAGTLLLFLAVFYLLRWVLLRLFPDASLYSRWSTGIILAILLAVLLYLTAGSDNRAER